MSSAAEDLDDERGIEISWLEISLVIAGLALAFQLWPMAFYKTADVIYDTFDLTTWGWRSYLVANVLAFIALAVIRLRQSRS